MPKTIAVPANLAKGCHAAEKLLEQYGPENIWQVQKLSENIFQARFVDGRVAFAMVMPNGSITVREAEAVW